MARHEGGGAIRIFVVATSAVRRAGLEALIKSEPEFLLAGSTSASWTSYAGRDDIDVILIDSDAPPIDAAESPAIPALVLLADTGDARGIARLLRSGVRAILPRESDAEEIVSAIVGVHSGLVLLSASAAEALAAILSDHELESEDEPIEEITSREIEILRLLARGLMNKEIAAQLGISEHTVKFHIGSILAKLGASTRTEAVTLGIRRD